MAYIIKVIARDKTKAENYLEQPTGAMVKSRLDMNDPFYAFCISGKAWKYIYKKKEKASLWEETEKLYKDLESFGETDYYVEIDDLEGGDYVIRLIDSYQPPENPNPKDYKRISHYGIF